MSAWSMHRRIRQLRAALDALTKATTYVDNGYCSLCGGPWPNEHLDGCAGKAALDALEGRPA